MSEGNGHPYSWSAICNGYDERSMADCPFPVIPEYLKEQEWPEAQLPGVEVTHVWTQDPAASAHVASSCNIRVVASAPEDMIGEVDAILLARDDAQNHARFAAPFLKQGLPVYIDKPIAHSRRNLDALRGLASSEDRLFTCSAMRYAPELTISAEDFDVLGEIRHIDIQVPKDWERYIIHGLEPVVAQIKALDRITDHVVLCSRNYHGLEIQWASGVSMSLRAFGATPTGIAFRVFGEKANKLYEFRNPFGAFKSAIETFRDQIRTGHSRVNWTDVEKIVEIIELGIHR